MTILHIPDIRHISEDVWREWQARWPNFHPNEMDSRDWSLKVETDALDQLQAVRTEWGRSMRVLSGYRNPAHNKAVGGAKKSSHLITCAWDIAIRNPSEGRKLEALARKHGARGIGRYPVSHFIHMDWRKTKPATWGRW